MKPQPPLLAIALLCACAPMSWVRPDATPEQAQSDGAECRIGAYAKYPENELAISHENKREPATLQDSDNTLREAEVANCMRTKGYSWQRAK